MSVQKWFDEHQDEYVEFDKIPNKDRRHPRQDLCAFLYLHEKLGGKGDVVSAAEHDQFWLAWDAEDLEKLTEEDVIYVLRCGVLYDDDVESLYMNA